MEEREEKLKLASEVGDPLGSRDVFDVFLAINRKPLCGVCAQTCICYSTKITIYACINHSTC